MGLTKVFLLGLLCFLPGVFASKDFKNETIACVFRQSSYCYKNISALGANFTVKYAQTNLELNATCTNRSSVAKCISRISPDCNSMHGQGIGDQIIAFTDILCTNRSRDQLQFLNASQCYNENLYTRYDCVNKYNPGSRTDAKSLCCSNLKQLKCLREKFTNLCKRNVTSFMNHVESVYRSQHSFVCGPYIKYCSTATTYTASLLTIVLAAVFLILRYI